MTRTQRHQRLYRRTKLRQWRKARHLTLAQLAEEANTTHATLSRLERGLHPYGQELLERLAIVLRTHPAALISEDPPEKKKP